MSAVKKGDRFIWGGVRIEVTRVHRFGDWADIKVIDPGGDTWTKRQRLPFDVKFEPVA